MIGMSRTNILARELRGTLVVLLVGALIVWLFARLNDDRLEAQAAQALAEQTTTTIATTTTSTTIPTSDNERLCSLATGFRMSLADVRVSLVDNAGDSLEPAGALPIDVGLHALGDIPVEVREARTVAGEEAFVNAAPFTTTTTLPPDAPTTTTEPPAPERRTPPPLVDTEIIDPLESGLLGDPQEVALNFYATASALRLGTITADFAAAADYFIDFVEIGGNARWDLEELAQSDFSDQWIALSTAPVVGVDATLEFIEEECSIRIGNGFIYREEAPELQTVTPIRVPTPVDPNASRAPATTRAPAPTTAAPAPTTAAPAPTTAAPAPTTAAPAPTAADG